MIRAKIAAQKEERAIEDQLAQSHLRVTEMTRLHAKALQENAKWQEHSHSFTLRLMKATEGLRLEVSRIRNMLLLYNFAWNMFAPTISRALKAQAEYERSTQGLIAVSGKLRI